MARATDTDDEERRERVQIHVWVEPETKARWTEHVDESPAHSSLSGLIRRSVESEIESGGSGGQTQRVGGGDVGNTDLSPVLDRLGDLTETVSSLDRRIDGLDDDVRDVKSSLELSREDSLDELAQRVFVELPKSKAKAESLAAKPPEDGRDESEPTGNPGELSERLNVPVSRIMAALDRLDEDMPGTIDATAGGTENNYGHYYAG